MKILLVFTEVKSTALPSSLNAKSTFQPILTWNLGFWAYALREMKILLVLSQINSLAIRSSREIKILTYFDVESRFLSLGAAWNEPYPVF